MTPDHEAAAAEYVLGTATAQEAEALARALESDPALATTIAAWERRLAPLAHLVPPEAPPPDLWQRIEQRVAPQPRPLQAGGPVRTSWRTRLLRAWAIAATATAALLAYLNVEATTAQPPMMTVMLADRSQTAWTASVAPDGALRLAALPPVSGPAETPTPEGRVLQLWALPPGATAPTSLALLPRNGRAVRLPAPAVRPVPGMLIEITQEPAGGSPIGRPTGPVLFIGRLSQPGPST